MLRIRPKFALAIALFSATVTWANSANAAITIALTPYTLANTGDQGTLAAAGYSAYVITATADGVTSTGVGGIDFSTGNDLNGGHGQFGIFGTLWQSWGKDQFGTTTPNPTGPLGSSDTTISNLLADSRFNSGFGLGGGVAHDMSGNPVTFEDNLGGGPTVSNGNQNGLGTFLRVDGQYSEPFGSSVNVAFIIAKNNTQLTVNGKVADNNSIDTFFPSTTITVGPVPEPASLGVLAIGGLALLARRRRKT